ncbi:hypothetical protein Agub_g1162 [Astrephomene gubernaculifera]|uniref:Uncharacterized protein n=1 Tax=Astrephomene gubernaculifera TaxID=47775 RepID=A0AAD3HH30_9CHLO|nr:hypothetical protein Agub_g1162 [Astrephomene gubernaculifera]
MAGRPHDVTLSVGLLEKLAGLKKPEPPKPVMAPRPGIQLPTRSPVSAEAARMLAQDKQLTRQLQATKEVSGLLVKAEESEVARMQAMADELVKKFSVPAKPAPCQSEASACTQCFKEHAKEAWRCAEVAEAYRQCSSRAFSAARGAAVARSG